MRLAPAAALLVACGLAAAGLAPRASAVIIACGDVDGIAGQRVTVTIELEVEGDEVVAGTQNDLTYDIGSFGIQPSDCDINPAIGDGTEADKDLATSVLTAPSPRVRNIVVANDNVNPIPSGALYTCSFAINPLTTPGEYTLETVNPVASSPEGTRLPVTTGNCVIRVSPPPTPTPTPRCREDEDCPSGQVCVDGECVNATPTHTPIGFCTDDEDCPEGQVCVDNRCVTPTPTATPIGFCTDDEDCPEGQVCVDNRCVTPTPTATPIGFCTDDEDCPEGQVCVDNRCVTPTPTVRKGGGGGGCSCEIDPRERPANAAETLALLLPALWLAWRARRRAPGAP